MAGALIKTQTLEFGNVTSVTGNAGNSYTDMNGSTINYTCAGDNSSFLLKCDCQVYNTATGGTNVHFVFNGIEYGGTTAAAPGSATTADAWCRFGNGAPTSGSYNITRLYPLEGLNLSKGTVVTAYLRAGKYSSSSGTLYYNYPGYSTVSTFTIFEFEPS